MTGKASEVRAWYNSLYASVGLSSTRPVEAYPQFLDLLDARPGTSLLDVSCGQGFLLKAAQQRGVAALGVDISDQAVRLAHAVSPESRVAVATGEALCFREHSFDYVTCLGSLEHFLDMGQGLREMQRVAKPDALLCIMVPNSDFVGWRVLGRRGTAQQDINEQLLSLQSWRRLFAQHDLQIVRIVPDRWHAEKWRHGQARGPLQRVKGMLLEAAWRAIPLRYEYQFIFLLRRRSTPPTGR
jgi:ubiquinone/menaquinone biosynthesis C-methylase UbiE